MSFELKISPKDRAAGRFIGTVRKALIKAALDEKDRSGITQQAIAQKLNVNRSVVNRLLRGDSNLTLRSVAEIAWALELKPVFELEPHKIISGTNIPSQFSSPASTLATKNISVGSVPAKTQWSFGKSFVSMQEVV